MVRLAPSLAPFTLFLAAGCAGSYGAMGQAVVSDDCPPGATHCSDRSGFDRPLASGATLRPGISFRLKGAGAPSLHFESADESVIAPLEGKVEGRSPGMSALLLVSDDGTVLDMFHVWVKAPTSIDLFALRGDAARREPISGAVELLVDESLLLETTLMGEGQALAGELEHTWKLDGPAAQLLEQGTSGRRRLVATEPGAVNLSIHAGAVYTALHVVVRPKDGSRPPAAAAARER